MQKQKSPHSEQNKKVRISELKSKYAKAKLSSTNFLINLFEKKNFHLQYLDLI